MLTFDFFNLYLSFSSDNGVLFGGKQLPEIPDIRSLAQLGVQDTPSRFISILSYGTVILGSR